MKIPALVTYDTESNEVIISLAAAEEEQQDVELMRLKVEGGKPSMGHIADMHRRN